MPGSTVPPPPKSGSGGYIALAAVMLAAMGGLIFWKLNSGEATEVVEQTSVAPQPKDPEPMLDAAPPPPPPEEEVAEPKAPEPEKKVASTGGGTSGCSGACSGTLSAEGQSALRAKGGQARGCYNRALRQDATLSGKMTLAVRISPSGSVCSASVVEDTLQDAAVSTCVTQMFRSGKFPPPQGGCAEVNVPLNFVAPK